MSSNDRIFLVFGVVVSGLLASACATTAYGPYDVADCSASQGESLFKYIIGPSDTEQTIKFEAIENGDVCVVARRLETYEGGREADESVRFRIGTEPMVRALVGGTEHIIEYDKDAWRQDEIAFAVQLDSNVEQALHIKSGDVAVLIEAIRRSFPPDPDENMFPEIPPYVPPHDGGGSPAMRSIRLPEMTCDGQLLGFEHPMRFGPNGGDMPGRPEIHRKAWVGCDATWRIEYIDGRGDVTRFQSGTAQITDLEGGYSIPVPAKTVRVQEGSNLNIVLERLEAYCVPKTWCGHEQLSDPSSTTPELFIEAIEQGTSDFTVNILDVLDVISHGPEAAGYQTMLGARLISNASTHPERNDKPFIIHEQLDVHNEEHTRFIVWGLAGQPVRFGWQDWNDGGKDRWTDPRVQPCEFNNTQVCLPFDDACNPANCDGSDDKACLEYPMLQALLEADYDVWIVDYISGASDITHGAAAAPLLYQQILNFGGPLPEEGGGPIVGDNFAVDDIHAQDLASDKLARERFLRNLEADETILTADLASEYFNANALPEDLPATEPQSGSRRAVVAGYSMGGVLARIGLRMWEVRDALPHEVLRDDAERDITVVTTPSIFMEEPGDKIPLYVSMDVPHLGARVPTAIQAHVHRLKYSIDELGGLGGNATKQVNRAAFELSSTPSRQILQQQINPFFKTNSLGCFDPEEPDLSGCTVTSIEPDIQSRLYDADSVVFRERWLNFISTLEPASTNGLPATVTSIAVSNGGIGETRPVASREVANIKWHITDPGFDVFHRLCDESSGNPKGWLCIGAPAMQLEPQPDVQPEGSQWNNMCRRITSQRVDTAVGECDVDVSLGPLGGIPILGGLVSIGGAKGCFAEAFGIEIEEVTIDYRMRARFEDGVQIPGTGFPTLIPTKSALFQDENGNVSSAWRDAQWKSESQYHTNVDNDMCKLILFHADGALKQDEDGWPACDGALTIPDCRAGGRRPGNLLNPDNTLIDEAWCDTAPDDDTEFPGVTR